MKIDKDNYRTGIGYLLHPDHQQKGIIQEEVKAILTYGFTTMQLNSVKANVNPASEDSRNYCLKINLLKRVVLEKTITITGIFSILIFYNFLTPLIYKE